MLTTHVCNIAVGPRDHFQVFILIPTLQDHHIVAVSQQEDEVFGFIPTLEANKSFDHH